MSTLKKIEKLELSDSIQRAYDLFLCCTSFDDRCLSISESIESTVFKNVRVCHFENNYDRANLNFERLKNIFKDRDCDFDSIILKKHQPLENYDSIDSVFTKLNIEGSASILIDITTFTRENLLIILRFIKYQFKENIKVTLCYSPSTSYPKWLSKGVNEIRSILGYSGDYSPLKKVLLVVLTGFEYERSQILVDNYEPTKLLLGKSSSINSISPGLAKINEDHFEYLIKRNPQSDSFEFSCIDIQKTKKIILSIADKYENDYNVIVAPMNNKLSTLAVAFAAFENPNIQLCYASTNQYNIEEEHLPSNYFYSIELSDYLK